MATAAIYNDDEGVGGGCAEGGGAEEGRGGGPMGGRGCGMWEMGMWMWEMVMGRCPLGEGVSDLGDASDRPPGDAVRVGTAVVVKGEERHPHAHQHGGGLARRVAPLAMVRLLR